MAPEDFTTDLSDHLRRQGVDFDPAAIEAFAANFRREPAADHDIEALADRFREAQVAALKRKRARAWLEGMCIVGIGTVLLGLAAIAWIVPSSTGEGVEVEVDWVMVALIGGGGGVVGIGLLAVGLTSTIFRSHRLSAEIDRTRNPDAALPRN